MQPNKSLGQHWLFDENSLQQITAAAELRDSDTVLEIGPGLGTLTAQLVRRARRVVAVEADSQLAKGLSVRVSAGNLEVVESDILRYNLNSLPNGYKVVANIPYYLTSKILRILLEASNRPSLMSLLVQKEVAERVTATPGQMSILAFSVQYYAEARIMGEVPKELFEPMPKVDSAILQIRSRQEAYFPADVKKLFKLVKAGFAERRKKLVNSLAGGLHLDKQQLEQILAEAGISKHARAQELSMTDWHKLYRTTYK